MADLDNPGDKARLADYGTVVQDLRLIRAGQNVWEKQDRAWSEAAVGVDKQGRVLFIFCRTPHTMKDLNDFLLSLPLDLDTAMHVEGGPEASLSIHAGSVNVDLNGRYEPASSRTTGSACSGRSPTSSACAPADRARDFVAGNISHTYVVSLLHWSMRPFGETVLAWRLTRGMTQAQLARAAKLPRPNLSAIERGDREVTLRTLRALALALDVRPGALVDGETPGAGPPLTRTQMERIANAAAHGTALSDSASRHWCAGSLWRSRRGSESRRSIRAFEPGLVGGRRIALTFSSDPPRSQRRSPASSTG